jgi:hypothetical protein
MHSRTTFEPDGSTNEWTSPDGVSWTMCGTERFNLSKGELSKLKCACAVMKLDWRAQAARPRIARKIIAMYKAGLPEIVSPGIF